MAAATATPYASSQQSAAAYTAQELAAATAGSRYQYTPSGFSGDPMAMNEYMQVPHGAYTVGTGAGGQSSYGYTTRYGPDASTAYAMANAPVPTGSYITPLGGQNPGTQPENGMLSFYDTNVFGDGGGGIPDGFMAAYDPSTGGWSTAGGDSNGAWTQAGWGGWDADDGVIRKVIRKKNEIVEPVTASVGKKSGGSGHKKKVLCC